ncbi:MAG: thiamine phosphate synthase [Prevotella sp.]|jgi:thiamine-phosphate pyrophosphorylase|nr:thiamine phosphate synthase [Prevotella sp.]
MKLIVMTQPTFFVEEDKILTALFDEGLDTLHINKPNSEPLYEERLLSLLPKSCYDDVVVHQHYYLKQEYDLKGIHINDPETPTPDGFRKHVTRSTKNIGDLKEMKRQCDYVMLHSLFDSLHNDYKASLTIEEMQDARKKGLIDKKVYALGGMSLENIQIAKDLGFGGVVICGDLWNRFNIQHETDFHALIDHFKKLKKAIN